jgi:hypothetical protein
MNTKILFALTMIACLMHSGCGGGSSSSSNTPNPPSPPTPGGSTAPSWTLVGNTGFAQTWGITFDNAGNMYAAANNTSTGGLAKSTDKGKMWTPIMSGIDVVAGCPSFRSLGVAPDGTIFTINQACPGKTHFAYWLDNVSGTGTHWTKANIVGGNGVIGSGGMENGCAIAGDGGTIICPTASAVTLLSTDNARTWSKAAASPVGTQEQLFAVTIGNISYETVASSNVPTVSNTWFSLDNGSHWSSLPTPGGLNGALDAWTGAQAGAGANSGRFIYYQGNSGGNVGFYCWNGTPPAGSWVFCGNNQDVGQPSEYVTMMVTNRTHNRTIAVKYEDFGLKPIYSDDGSNWIDASNGLTCQSLATVDCGTNGGPKTAYVALDPTTGIFYISMKPGDIWATTASQDR